MCSSDLKEKMKSINLNITKAASFLAEGAVKAYEPKVKAAQEDRKSVV